MPLDSVPDWVLAHLRVIGERIRIARRAARLSQAELGELIGRDHKTISRWENAVTVPSLPDLLLLARALDVPPADLVG